MRNILIPIDMSHGERSDGMMLQAKELSDGPANTITLLYVLQEVPSYLAIDLPEDTKRKTVGHSKDYLKSLIEKYNLPATTDICIRQGNAFHEILEEAERRNTDLIVIASHKPGLSDYLLGSVAGKVVRHSQCSVLVLR